jgi:hypothetical protein
MCSECVNARWFKLKCSVKIWFWYFNLYVYLIHTYTVWLSSTNSRTKIGNGTLYRVRHKLVNTGWGISRLTLLYPKVESKMAAVAPMSRISCSFTPKHYILRARCVRQAVRVNRFMPHFVYFKPVTRILDKTYFVIRWMTRLYYPYLSTFIFEWSHPIVCLYIYEKSKIYSAQHNK